MGTDRKIIISILKKYKDFGELADCLYNCNDLYDLGIIDSEREQEIWELLAKVETGYLYQAFKFAHGKNPDGEHHVNELEKEIKSVLNRLTIDS